MSLSTCLFSFLFLLCREFFEMISATSMLRKVCTSSRDSSAKILWTSKAIVWILSLLSFSSIFLWFLAEQFLFTSHRVSRRRTSKQRRVPLWFESICSAAIAAVKLLARDNLTQFEHDPKYIVPTTTTAATTTTKRTKNERKFRVFRT